MSASIDERIVSMQFDNKQFESGVKESLNTLDKLKKSMNFDKNVKSLNELEKATKQLDGDKSFANMEKSLASLEKRFSTFGVAGMAAITNVTNSAMSMAKKLASKVVSPINKTLGQIKTGGLSRALKIEDARFKIKGLLKMTLGDIKRVDEIATRKVNKLMSSNGPILSAVKGTAYGLDAAAGAASNLLASGVKIGQLEGPLRAIAGAAAMTGRSYEQIGSIFSTVAGQGKLMTMQLRQFEIANVNAAKVVAQYMGKTEAEVRDMVQKGQIDFQTFSKAMQKAFGDTAKAANDTMQGALSNVNAALSRIGAAIATPFDEMKRRAYVALIPFIDNIATLLGEEKSGGIPALAKAFDTLAGKFDNLIKNKEFQRVVSGFVGALNLGIKTAIQLMTPIGNILKGIWNIIKGIGSVLKPIAVAFFDVFGTPSLKSLTNITESFKNFTEKLRVSSDTAETIRKIFRGFFQVLSVGINTIKIAWGWLKKLLDIISPLGTALLKVGAMIATFIGDIAYYFEVVTVTVAYVLNYFGGLATILRGIVGVVAIAIGGIASVITTILAPIGGFLKSIAVSLGWVSENASVFETVMYMIKSVVNSVLDFCSALFEDFGGTVSSIISGIIGWLRGAFGGALSWMADALEAVWNFFKKLGNDFLDVFKQSGSVVEGIKKIFSDFGQVLKDAGEAIAGFAKPIYVTVVNALGTAFSYVADGFSKFAAQITPGRIAAIAFLAVLVLMAVAIKRLIDTMAYAVGIGAKAITNLASSLAGLANTARQTLQIFNDKLLGKGDRIPKFINILRELAKIMLILFGALYMLSTLPKDQLWGAVAAMGAITAGFIALALACTFLSKHIAKSKLGQDESFKNMAKGMLALAGAIGVLALAFKIMDGIELNGLIIKAIAINAMIVVLAVMADHLGKKDKEFAKGCIGVFLFALGIGRLVKALVDICKEPLHKVLQGLPIMLLIMLAFGHIAKQINGIKLPGTMALIAMIIALKLFINETKKLMENTKGVSPAAIIAGVGGVAAALVVVAYLLKKSQEQIIESLRDFGKAMILIAGAVFILANVVKLFQTIKMSDVAKGMIVIAGIMGLIAALEFISYRTQGSKMVSFGAGLILMSTAVAVLGGLVVLFGMISLKTIAHGMAVLAGISALFMGMEYLAQCTKDAKPLEFGGMLMLMAGAVALLSGVIVVLGLLDLRDVVQGGVIVAAFIGLIALLELASKRTAQANPKELGKMFLMLAFAIGIMSGCLVALGLMDMHTVVQGGAIIAAFLIAMTILTHGLKTTKVQGMEIAKKTLASFLVVLGIMMTVILAMKMLEGIEWQSTLAAAAGLSACILALSGCMWIMSKAKMPPAKSMLGFVQAAFAFFPIAGALVILANMPWDACIAGAVGLSACILAYGTAFMLIGKSGATMTKEQGQAFLAGSLALIPIAAALWIVANQPWDGILAAAVGLSACLIVYGQVFSWISTCPKPNEGEMALFLLGSVALLPIAIALMMASRQPWDQILAAGGAISLALLAYAAAFRIVAKIQKPDLGALAIFLAGTLSLIVVAQAIRSLCDKGYDYKTMLGAAASIGGLIMAFSMVFRLLSMVPVAAALQGALNLVLMFSALAVAFDAVVLLVGGMMTAIGAIDEWLEGDLAGWVHRAIPILKDVGAGIGGFIGELIGTFAESIISHLLNLLPKLGDALAQFGRNITPFFDSLEGIDANTVAAASSLADTIMTLTGASFISGIQNFLSNIPLLGGLFEGDSIADLGTNLVEFGGVIKDFQDATVGVDPEKVKPVAEAAAVLAGISEHIENSGGLFQVFTGTTDWEGFSKGLVSLIDAMKSASAEAVNINKSSVEMVAECGEMLGKMSDTIPRDNGFFSLFTGSIDWKGFKKGCVTFVKGMVQICQMPGIKDITDDKVKMIENCGNMLVEMADKIPNSGGVVSWFAGNNDLKDFAVGIEAFGDGISRFAASTKGMNEGQLDRARIATKLFVGLCTYIRALDYYSIDVSAFTKLINEQIPEYARMLTTFSNNLNGLDETNIERGKTATQTLLNIFQMMNNNSAIPNFKDFASSLQSFGTALKGLNSDLRNLDDTDIDLYVDRITYLAKSFNKSIKGTDFKNVSGFAKTLEELNKVVDGITTEKSDALKSFTDRIVYLGDMYRLFGEKVKSVKEKSVNGAIKSIKKMMDTFAGKKQEKVDFGNFEKLAKNMGKIADLAKIANKADGKGNLNDLTKMLNELGKNSKDMVGTMNMIGSKDWDDFSANLDRLKEQFEKISKIKIKKGSALGEALKSIADGAQKALKDGLEGMDKNIKDYKKKGISAVKKFAAGLQDSKSLEKVKSAAEAITKKFNDSISVSEYSKTGRQVLSGFILGLRNSEKLNDVSKAAADIGRKTLLSLNKSLEVKSPSRATKQSAYYTVMGYVDGMTKYSSMVYKSGYEMGEEAKDGIKTSLDIHSPSGFSIEAAYNTAKGWILGCKDKAMEIFNSGFSFGGSFIDGLKSAIGGINKDQFSGDKMFDKIKSSLGLDKLGELMDEDKTSKAVSKALGKGLKAGATAGGADAGKAAGGAAAKAATKEFTEKMKMNVPLLALSIKGIDITGLTGEALRNTAKQFGFTMQQYTAAMSTFKEQLKDFDASVQKVVTTSSNVVGSYVKKFKDVSRLAAGAVTELSTGFADVSKQATAQVKAEQKAYSKAIKALEKDKAKYEKQLKNKKTTKKQKIEIKKAINEINKEVKSYTKKMNKTSIGNVLVNNFAESLYKDTDEYKEAKKSINKLSKSYKTQYKKAQKDAKKYINIIESNASDAKKKKAYESLQKIQDKLNTTRNKISEEWDKISKGPEKAFKEWKKAIDDALKDFTKFSELDYSNVISGLEKVDKVAYVLDDVAQGYDLLSESASNAAESVNIFGDSASSQFDAFSTSLDKTSSSADGANGAIQNTINLLERFTKTGTVAKEALFENADSQLEAYEEFLNGLAQMKAQGFNQNLIDEMAKQGPQALNYIRGFMSMTADEVSKYNDRYARKLEHENSTLVKGAEETATQSYRQAVKDAIAANNTWEEALSDLASRGVSSGIIQKIRDMGQEQGMAYVNSLKAETADGISELNGLYEQMSSVSIVDNMRAQVELNESYATIMDKLRNTDFNGEKLDEGFLKELESQGKESAIAYGNSILKTLDQIPTINEYYAKLNQNEDTGSLLDLITKKNQEIADSAKKISDFKDQLTAKGVNNNVLEYFESLDTDKALEFINKFNSDMNKYAKNNGVENYISSLNKQFEQFNRTGAQVITDNIQSQIDSVNDYNEDMEALSKQFAGGQESIYYKYLEDMGTEGATYVKSLAHATNDEIQKFQEMVDAQTEANNKARLDKLKREQKKKYEILNNYGRNLEALASAGFDKNFLQSILDMGPEKGAEMADLYANLLTTDPKGLSELYYTVTQQATDTIEECEKRITTAISIANQKSKDKTTILDVGLDVEKALSVLNGEETKVKITKAAEEFAKTYTDSNASFITSNESKETLTAAGVETGETFTKAVTKGVSSEKITKSVTTAMSSEEVKKSMKSAANEFVKGVKAGLKDETVIEVADKMAKKIVKAYRKYINTDKGNSISKNLCLGLSNGITEYGSETKTSAQSLGESILNAIKLNVKYSSGYEIGYQMSNGVLKGLLSLENELKDAATRISDTVAKSMREAAKVKSPSRVTMEIGEYIAEGLALGLENGEDTVKSKAELIADRTTEAMMEAMAKVDSILNSEDIQPVIKPRLDLSEVTAKAKGINSMFNSNMQARLVTDGSNSDSQNQNEGNNVTFVQNNYSPKALSREEIYRQTNNLFARTREAVIV